jgi:hypothetical protein
MGFQETISSFYCADKTLVGYENGLIVVINKADGAMLKVVDIISCKTKVNHLWNLMVLFMFPVTLVLCNLI